LAEGFIQNYKATINAGGKKGSLGGLLGNIGSKTIGGNIVRKGKGDLNATIDL
jgi:hypothetical protein